MSAYREALRALLAGELRCPKCDESNLPPPATPTIEVDHHGRASCNTCGHVWTINKES